MSTVAQQLTLTLKFKFCRLQMQQITPAYRFFRIKYISESSAEPGIVPVFSGEILQKKC